VVSRLEIPVIGKTLWNTGDIKLRVELTLLLKGNFGAWQPRRFLIDTGTEITTMPARTAKRLGLAMPQTAARGVVFRQTGLEIRSGFLRFRFPGMDQTEYVVPCFFLGNPDTPPLPGPAAMMPRKLLQPLALLGQLRFTFDRDTRVNAPYGTLIIEKKTP
jgi:hypothetical protein